MIKLDFAVPNTDSWNNWVTNCAIATVALMESYQNYNPIEITNLYRGEIDRYHVHPFYGKCAYCESKVETTSPDYVEHFRPKMGVRDVTNAIVQITINGATRPHPGYYWLAYRWENLLPTCWKCNTWHADNGINIGKGNRFPVTGSYGMQPGDEAEETPDLINPMFEDPAEHIYIDNLGVLHAHPGSVKGVSSIDLFGLNKREPVINARKKVYENISRKVRMLFTLTDIQERNEELADLALISKGRDEYTIAAKKAISDVLANAEAIKNAI